MVLPADLSIAKPKTPTLASFSNAGVVVSTKTSALNQFTNISPVVNLGVESPGTLFASSKFGLDYEHRQSIETPTKYNNLGALFGVQAGYNRTNPGLFATASAEAKIVDAKTQSTMKIEKYTLQGDAGYRFLFDKSNQYELGEIGPFVDFQKYNSLNEKTTFAGVKAAYNRGVTSLGAKVGIENKKPSLELFLKLFSL